MYVIYGALDGVDSWPDASPAGVRPTQSVSQSDPGAMRVRYYFRHTQIVPRRRDTRATAIYVDKPTHAIERQYSR